MSEKLKVYLSALGEAATSLGRIAGDFSTTDISVSQMQSSIGQASETSKLRSAVEHFANSWSVRRKKVQEDVTYLADMARTVSDVLSKTDQDMATSVSNTTTNTGLTPTGSYTPGGSNGGGSAGGGGGGGAVGGF